VDDLLDQKKSADEKAFTAPIALLQQWLEKTLVYCKEKADALEPVRNDTVVLDALFRKYVGNDL
jgi:hypothetical protein